jgi:hypothetical protein
MQINIRTEYHPQPSIYQIIFGLAPRAFTIRVLQQTIPFPNSLLFPLTANTIMYYTQPTTHLYHLYQETRLSNL